MTTFNALGIDPTKFILQTFMWFVILGIPGLFATRKVLSSKSGSDLPLWLFFIWFVPFIGPFATLYFVRTPTTK